MGHAPPFRGTPGFVVYRHLMCAVFPADAVIEGRAGLSDAGRDLPLPPTWQRPRVRRSEHQQRRRRSQLLPEPPPKARRVDHTRDGSGASGPEPLVPRIVPDRRGRVPLRQDRGGSNYHASMVLMVGGEWGDGLRRRRGWGWRDRQPGPPFRRAAVAEGRAHEINNDGHFTVTFHPIKHHFCLTLDLVVCIGLCVK